MAHKSTKATVERRILAVNELLLRSASRSDILQYATKEGWGVQPRIIDEYISRCKVLWQVEVEAERKDAYARHLKKRDKLYMKAFAAEDYHLCLEIDRDKAKLEGLYIVKLEHANKGGQPFVFQIITSNQKDLEDESERKQGDI